MRRTLIAMIMAMLSLFSFAAQKKKKTASADFNKGTAAIDFTIGTPTKSGTDNKAVMVPPLSFSLDIGSIGGLAGGRGCVSFGGIASYYLYDVWGSDDGYYHDRYYYPGWRYYDAELHNIFVAFRSAFHFGPVSNLDIYGGLLMGGHWKVWNYVEGYDYHKRFGENPTRSKFSFGVFAGVHYWFTSAFGVKAEFGADTGAGIPYAQAGISFKIN